jgi:hypothetical protein
MYVTTGTVNVTMTANLRCAKCDNFGEGVRRISDTLPEVIGTRNTVLNYSPVLLLPYKKKI